MISMTIEDRGLSATLQVTKDTMADLTVPIVACLELCLDDSRREIVSMGSLFGEGWAPMSIWTEIISKKLYGIARDPMSLLDASGALIESLFRDGPGNIFEAGPREGSTGTEMPSPHNGYPYANALQYGTSKTFRVLQGKGYTVPGMPPRPFLGWHESRGDAYIDIFANYLTERWDGVPAYSGGN